MYLKAHYYENLVAASFPYIVRDSNVHNALQLNVINTHDLWVWWQQTKPLLCSCFIVWGVISFLIIFQIGFSIVWVKKLLGIADSITHNRDVSNTRFHMKRGGYCYHPGRACDTDGLCQRMQHTHCHALITFTYMHQHTVGCRASNPAHAVQFNRSPWSWPNEISRSPGAPGTPVRVTDRNEMAPVKRQPHINVDTAGHRNYYIWNVEAAHHCLGSPLILPVPRIKKCLLSSETLIYHNTSAL